MTGKGNKSGEAAHRQRCPDCGKLASGNFCQHCGAALGRRFCNQCGHKLDAGAKFCNQCGAPAPGAGAPAARSAGRPGGPSIPPLPAGPEARNNLPWYAAGVFLLGVILVLGWPILSGRRNAPPPAAAPGENPAAGQSTLDLATMTPREAADRLFNRVMTAASNGDSATAQGFMPMAISAYERARPLDLDGLFHLSLLQRTAGDMEAALANARQILDRYPDHLLGLAAAAEAAHELGQDDVAREHYRHLLEVWNTEQGKELEEYLSHQGLMAGIRSEAEAFLGSG